MTELWWQSPYVLFGVLALVAFAIIVSIGLAARQTVLRLKELRDDELQPANSPNDNDLAAAIVPATLDAEHDPTSAQPDLHSEQDEVADLPGEQLPSGHEQIQRGRPLLSIGRAIALARRSGLRLQPVEYGKRFHVEAEEETQFANELSDALASWRGRVPVDSVIAIRIDWNGPNVDVLIYASGIDNEQLKQQLVGPARTDTVTPEG